MNSNSNAAPAARAHVTQIALLETHAGAKWRVGSPPPLGDGEKASSEDGLIKIVRIFFVDDQYEVYVYPTGGQLAKLGTGILYKLSAFAVKQTMAFAPVADLMALMHETEEDLMRDDPDDPEDPDDNLEDDPAGKALAALANEIPQASPASIAAAQAALNGTGA